MYASSPHSSLRLGSSSQRPSASRLLAQELASPGPQAANNAGEEAMLQDAKEPFSASPETAGYITPPVPSVGKLDFQVSKVAAAARRAIAQGQRALHQRDSLVFSGGNAASGPDDRQAPTSGPSRESQTLTQLPLTPLRQESQHLEASLQEPEARTNVGDSPVGSASFQDLIGSVAATSSPGGTNDFNALQRERNLDAERRALEIERSYERELRQQEAEARLAEARGEEFVMKLEEAKARTEEGMAALREELEVARQSTKKADAVTRQRAAAQRELRRKSQQELDATKAELAEIVTDSNEAAKGEQAAIQRLKRQLAKLKQQGTQARKLADELETSCRDKEAELSALDSKLDTCKLKRSEARAVLDLLDERVKEVLATKPRRPAPISKQDDMAAAVAQRALDFEQASLNTQLAEVARHCHALELEEVKVASELGEEHFSVERLRQRLVQGGSSGNEEQLEVGIDDGQSHVSCSSSRPELLGAPHRRHTLNLEKNEVQVAQLELASLRQELSEASRVAETQAQQRAAVGLNEACEQLLGAASLGERNMEALQNLLVSKPAPEVLELPEAKSELMEPAVPEEVLQSTNEHRLEMQLLRGRHLEAVCAAEQRLSSLDLALAEISAAESAEEYRRTALEGELRSLRHLRQSVQNEAGAAGKAALEEGFLALQKGASSKEEDSQAARDESGILSMKRWDKAWTMLSLRLTELMQELPADDAGSGLDCVADALRQAAERCSESRAAGELQDAQQKVLAEEAAASRATEASSEAASLANDAQRRLPEALQAVGELEERQRSLEQSCEALRTELATRADVAEECKLQHEEDLAQGASLRQRLTAALQAEMSARLELCARLEAESAELQEQSQELRERSSSMVAQGQAAESALQADGAARKWCRDELQEMCSADEELETRFQELARRADSAARACGCEDEGADRVEAELAVTLRQRKDTQIAISAEVTTMEAAVASLRSERQACQAAESQLSMEEMRAREAQEAPAAALVQLFPSLEAMARRGVVMDFAWLEQELHRERFATKELELEACQAASEQNLALEELAAVHTEAKERKRMVAASEAMLAEERAQQSSVAEAAQASDAEVARLAQQLQELVAIESALELERKSLLAEKLEMEARKKPQKDEAVEAHPEQSSESARAAGETHSLRQQLRQAEADQDIQAQALVEVTARAAAEEAVCQAVQQRLRAARAELELATSAPAPSRTLRTSAETPTT